MIGCKQCGLCCKAIALRYSKKYVRDVVRTSKRAGDKNTDGLLMLNHWKRIPRLEAEAINPEYIGTHEGYYFYRCNKLKDNKCSDHGGKTRICSGYPFYDDFPDPLEVNDKLMTSKCGFYMTPENTEEYVEHLLLCKPFGKWIPPNQLT